MEYSVARESSFGCQDPLLAAYFSFLHTLEEQDEYTRVLLVILT